MDLGTFISVLDQNGYLKKIDKQVDWLYEIGKICRQNINSPLLFENIKDYKGNRLFTGGFSRIPLIALALGLPADISLNEMIRVIQKRIADPVSPRFCQLNQSDYRIFDSRDVNLYDLPVPWWNELDGGRYLGTWHINVTKDPESKKRNLGVYRMMILNKRQATVSASQNSHIAIHMRAAERVGRDLEMAVGIGVDEAIVLAGASGFSLGADEYSIAGGLTRNAVDLVNCNTVDLEIPCNCEFVVEGVLKKGVRVKDGPFFDYTGEQNVNKNAFLFDVRSVKMKREPVFRGMSVGCAGAEDHVLFHVLSHLGLVDFHGSALKQKIQNIFLKRGYYRLFMQAGKMGHILKKKNRRTQNETV
jgi:UbiD family decarboxylase